MLACTRYLWLCLALGLALILTLTTGCEKPITAKTIRKDMTPELTSLTRTSEQRKNDTARAVNTTTRQIADDWDMIWFLDRPLRMNQYVVP